MPVTPADLRLPTGPAGVNTGFVVKGPSLEQGSIRSSTGIAEISRTTYPGESMVLTGVGLANARLRVWMGGREFDVDPLRASNDRMFAVLPLALPGTAEPLPRSTMLVWPTRGDQAGDPIRVNSADAWWSWPVRLQAQRSGQRLRLFGQNLYLSSASPRIVLELVGVDDPGIDLKVTKAEPYCLEVSVPDDLTVGTYKVWAHNGTGGAFGWSDPVLIDVVKATPAPVQVFQVDDYPGTDTQKIHAACRSARAAGGGIVQLSARTYRLPDIVHVHGDQPIVLQGAGMGRWDTDTQRFIGPGTLLIDQTPAEGDVVILLSASGAVLRDLTLVNDHTGGPTRNPVRMAGVNQLVQRVRVVNRGPTPIPCIVVSHRGLAGSTIDGCDLHTNRMGVLVHDGAHGLRINNTRVRGYFSQGIGTEADAFVNMGSSRFIVEHCEVTSHARTEGKVLSRTCLIYNSGVRNTYLAHNRSIDVGPHPSAQGIARNLGEQYIFHQRGPLGGVYRAVDAGRDWVTLDADAPAPSARHERDWVVFIAKGRGLGQYRPIVNLKGDRIEIGRPWRIVPDADSVLIIQRVFRQNIVYDNVIDPRPDGSNEPANFKTVGVYFYLGAFNNIVADNRINHVAVGVAFACDIELPNGWNLVRDNTISNLRGWAGGTAYMPMFYNEHSRGLEPKRLGAYTHITSIGNIFRANTAAGGRASAAIGWLRHREARDQLYMPSADHGITLSVIENNRFIGVDRGVLLSAPANWTLLRGNTFGFDQFIRQPVEVYKPARVIRPLLLDPTHP